MTNGLRAARVTDTAPSLADELLHGAAAIAQEMFGNDDREHQRKIYHLRPKLNGAIFQLDENGMLLAFRSRLRAEFERHAAQEEQRIAAAAIIKPASMSFRRRARVGK
jgi:hypothetical protein